MQKQDAWARFWQGGSLTSFGDRFAQGYQGELRSLWENFFGLLPASAVVVDLGAGNGALEEIAAALCERSDQRLTVHAIDLAPRLPAHFKGREDDDACSIVWHPGTPNEATGLEDRSVDAVIGNYAFEYGDESRTIAEIARILKPAGKCRFLMHHAQSNIITGSRVELDVLEAELRKGGFLDAVRDYLREFGDIRKPAQFEKLKASGKAEPLRIRMNQRHAEALDRATTQNAVVLIKQIMQWTAALVTPPMFFESKAELLKRLGEIRHELEANRARLHDMQLAGVDEERMQRIVALFSERGLDARAERYHVAEVKEPVGWCVDVCWRSEN